ncbi:glycosyltransferase family 4 protein [Domibacillus aminovorans]|uniref:Glycosyltransferase n=1 Tax=Domibacillus aminovorans TaxID=29332 RepID=A0A177L2W8_9BACI|nr:glycosyltransferase family 4 protein [Domibacillus aminovorans]OAH59744.1 glycosyltransferase [Domibacillus aminovorans]
MNVLLMTDKLMTGGAEYYFCKLENQLKHSKLVFYTAAGGGELYEQINNKKHFINMSHSNHIANLIMIKRKVKEYDIDIIHANSLRMVLYAVAIQKMMKKKLKIIYTKHNVTMIEKSFRPVFTRLLNRYVTKIITVSGYEQENLFQLGVQKEKITTIYNGVDLGQFMYHQKEKDNVYKVGILARLSPEKNHELFLEIAKKLKQYPEIKFYIGGDGPQYPKIHKMIEEFELTHHVQMIGEVKNPESFIKDMDVLVLTSHREVFPMVVLEAMAVGTPLVSINIGGIKEAITSDEFGCLVSGYSADRFCEHILAIKEDQQFRNKLVNSARDRVQKNFSLEKMVTYTMREYLNI